MSRARARGAMMPVMAASMLLLAMIGIGSLTIMRIVLAKQETQRVADAACLAAATITKTAGLPLDGPKQAQARAIAGGNHPGLPFAVTIDELPETPDLVSFACKASVDVSAPAMIWNGGKVTVTASATGAIPQVTLTQAVKKYPKLVLVLDYSGSMTAPLWSSQSGAQSITVLKTAVNALLKMSYDIKYGLVLFSTDVFDKVTIALGDIGKLTQDVNSGTWVCPKDAAEVDCFTDSWDALDAAHQLFGAWDDDESRYVLFVSDGRPETGSVGYQEGITKTEKAAQGLWDDAKATILTLQLINGDPGSQEEQDLDAFMHTISGSPECRGDPHMYFNADSESSLNDLMVSIGNAIACPLKLPGPLPAHTAVHVFLREPNGSEEPLLDASRIPRCSGAQSAACNAGPPSQYATVPGDLSDQKSCTYYQDDFFLYYAPKQSIFVTPTVCGRILNDKDTVVVRYAHTEITK